jgi:phage/plasmid-like protein (TIGR03299 family)
MPLSIAGTDIVVPDKVATVRTDTNEVLGVVSENYEICQNEDAFAFVDSVDNVEIIKAGQTYTGMVYMIGKMPSTKVLNDEFTPYLIFQNGHNGKYTVKTTICPLRIVCQNQFNMAFKESANTISIQHSRNYPARLAEAEKLIKRTAQYMQNFGNTAEELAMLKIKDTDTVRNIINAFFTYDEKATDRQIRTIEEQREQVFTAYNADDNANFTGTVWGLVNGFSDYITHREMKNTKNKNDSQFMSVTFDPRMFTAFVNHVQAYVA